MEKSVQIFQCCQPLSDVAYLRCSINIATQCVVAKLFINLCVICVLFVYLCICESFLICVFNNNTYYHFCPCTTPSTPRTYTLPILNFCDYLHNVYLCIICVFVNHLLFVYLITTHIIPSVPVLLHKLHAHTHSPY